MNDATNLAVHPPAATGDVITLHRRSIDRVLVGFGALIAIVLVVAGGLLTWGHDFAADYVGRELRSQHISFPDEAALAAEGRTDLNSNAGKQLATGGQAEAYASYINGHLQKVANGATFADLGTPETAANKAVTDAKAANASTDEIAKLQTAATTIANQRNTLFKGETLRGLLLSTYAWSTIGSIALIAAVVAYAAAVVAAVLVVLGVVHLRRSRADGSVA
jgi:hypothetical protein